MVNSLPDVEYDYSTENNDDNGCLSLKCGVNAECTDEFGAYCNCLKGFAGDPYDICYENPCEKNACGANTTCKIEDNQVHCNCFEGFVGNPLDKCWEIGEDICDPNPCGNNTVCIREPTPGCICLPDFYDAPPSCRKGCTSNEMCADNQYCVFTTNKCVNGCRNDGNCAEDEFCERSGSNQNCKKEDEYCSYDNKCEKGCTFNYHCKENEYCDHFSHKCVNPCEDDPNICGLHSVCRTTDHSRSVKCSCEDGFISIPYEGCQKSSFNETITAEKFDCKKYCAKYAKCELFNGQIECFCPDESYNRILNPFDSCIISPSEFSSPPGSCLHKNRPECAVEISPSLVATLLG